LEEVRKMETTVQAIYENGVFKPVEPVACKEHEHVTIIIRKDEKPFEDWEDTEFSSQYALEADESVTLEQVREALAKIPGNMSDDIRRERDDSWTAAPL
jgi:predicted DNA-binding antitoxin AbrB/MazE fold protein